MKGKKEFLENLIFVVVLFSRELRLRPSVGPFDDDVYTNVFLFSSLGAFSIYHSTSVLFSCINAISTS